ncbi:MAG: hypothetical protein P4L82_14020 [Ancalomicrobiaceae bacterium]|nr:hypothetical protein [Ancalomicrobiaceae bacterium]
MRFRVGNRLGLPRRQFGFGIIAHRCRFDNVGRRYIRIAGVFSGGVGRFIVCFGILLVTTVVRAAIVRVVRAHIFPIDIAVVVQLIVVPIGALIAIVRLNVRVGVAFFVFVVIFLIVIAGVRLVFGIEFDIRFQVGLAVDIGLRGNLDLLENVDLDVPFEVDVAVVLGRLGDRR